MVLFIKQYWKTNLALIILLLLIILVLNNKSLRRQVNDLEAEKQINSGVIDSLRNKDSLLVNEKEVAVFERDKKIKELSDAVFNLDKENKKLVKQVNYYGQIKQTTKIDSVFAYFIDTIFVDTFGASYVSVPKTFKVENTNYNIDGIVQKEGVLINSVQIENTLSFREIEKKQGLFKPTVTTIQVVNSNPYVHTTGITSTSVKHKPTAWNRWIKPTLVGIGVGIVTYKIAK